ncbi:MAG TPA: acyl-CoA dehydrogenase family protein [Zeimonas sp.]|nr:acyl-CoA dehydrogenase family protein [Zeimonas sp.]
MHLEFTPEEQDFRAVVREFIDGNLPAEVAARVNARKPLGKDDFARWQKILHGRGWGVPTWPREFGGAGWTPIQQFIFEEESADAGAPMQLPFGPKMVGPVIIAFGNEFQRKRFLPGIASGEDWWCQGFSEPGAGSDLASLKMRAERVPGPDGGHYLVNGQKTWTTYAHYADWIFCLVRTRSDGRPQEGISFLLVDMKTPGVSVRPIVMLDGGHEINEVWFENVEVPMRNLVGDENRGWTYAKFLLDQERTDIARVGRSKAALKQLKGIARRELDGGRPLIENQRFRDRIAQVELELIALEITNLRALSTMAKKREPGPEPSLLKLKGSEIEQMLSELMMQALGHRSIPRGEGSGNYFNCRKTSIYGGSNEIQKNIISRMILGL